MTIEQNGKRIVLNTEEDFEFIRLIHHIIQVRFGDIRLEVRHSKPFEVTETIKVIRLTKTAVENKD